MRVVSYNLLSTLLAGKDYHIGSDATHLETAFRFELLKKKLIPEIKRNAVFCLQEVDTGWHDLLRPFFSECKYALVGQSFGKSPTNWGGVFIAYPAGIYESPQSRIIKMSEAIEQNRMMRGGEIRSLIAIWYFQLWWTSWLLFGLMWIFQGMCWLMARLGTTVKCFGCSRFVARIKPLVDRSKKFAQSRKDPWKRAADRDNLLVWLELKTLVAAGDSNCRRPRDRFCVATYHMPCQFRDAEVMEIHAAVASNEVMAYSRTNRYVLAGDFNMKPTDSLYRAVVSGNFWARIKRSAPPLLSAYMTVQKREPAFTCHSQIIGVPHFRDCLDYIFYSEGWVASEVLPISDTPSAPSYPSAEEPSDHVMIAATLQLIPSADSD